MAIPDQDPDIYELINALSKEEERLWASAGDGRGLDPEERRRLDDIKIELDRRTTCSTSAPPCARPAVTRARRRNAPPRSSSAISSNRPGSTACSSSGSRMGR